MKLLLQNLKSGETNIEDTPTPSVSSGCVLIKSIIGAAAGSIFVFKGKYRAVLINYPSASEKYSIIEHK